MSPPVQLHLPDCAQAAAAACRTPRRPRQRCAGGAGSPHAECVDAAVGAAREPPGGFEPNRWRHVSVCPATQGRERMPREFIRRSLRGHLSGTAPGARVPRAGSVSFAGGPVWFASAVGLRPVTRGGLGCVDGAFGGGASTSGAAERADLQVWRARTLARSLTRQYAGAGGTARPRPRPPSRRDRPSTRRSARCSSALPGWTTSTTTTPPPDRVPPPGRCRPGHGRRMAVAGGGAKTA